MFSFCARESARQAARVRLRRPPGAVVTVVCGSTGTHCQASPATSTRRRGFFGLARCGRPAGSVLSPRWRVGEVGEARTVALDRAEVIVTARALEGAHEEQLPAVG